jgi:DNA processing protein
VTARPSSVTGESPVELPADVLRARAYLSRVSEPASLALWAFVRRVGPVPAAEAIRVGSAPKAVLDVTAARRTSIDVAADLDAAERHGVRLVAPESPDWPHFAFGALERLGRRRVAAVDGGRADEPAGIDDAAEPVERLDRTQERGWVPPLALWVAGPGELAGLGLRSVGIVGARAATPYGEHVTAELAYGLARHAVVVVSGGAYGIDAAAHRAALAAAGTTVVVSAAGLDRAYPAGNATLFARAADEGLLVSESPIGCAPQRHRFLSRNRLIAAFSTGVVVVEAARRSGASNTASHGFTQGRPVMAVPGPVTSAMSAGCHDLLRREPQPALLVTGVDDVLAVVGSIGEGLPGGPPADPGDAPDRPLRDRLDLLDVVSRRVFDGLPARRPARVDEISMRSGLPALEVIRALPGLELAGLVESSDGGYRVARHR